MTFNPATHPAPPGVSYLAEVAEALEHVCKYQATLLGCPHLNIGAGDIQAVMAMAGEVEGQIWQTDY